MPACADYAALIFAACHAAGVVSRMLYASVTAISPAAMRLLHAAMSC